MKPEKEGEVKTRKEAAQYLRICVTTLSRLDIPKTKVRRRVFYRQSVLDKWLNEHTSTQEGIDHRVRV